MSSLRRIRMAPINAGPGGIEEESTSSRHGPAVRRRRREQPIIGLYYRPADVLQINVWKEPEASVTAAVVRSDGIISLPLVRESRWLD